MSPVKVNNSKEFFETVKLDSDGSILIRIVDKTGSETKIKNAYEFFKSICFDENGRIKIFT